MAVVYGYASYRLAPQVPKPADVSGAGLAVVDGRGRLLWQGRSPRLADIYVAAGRAYVTGEVEGKPGDVLDLASGRRVGAWTITAGSYVEWLGPRLRTSVILPKGWRSLRAPRVRLEGKSGRCGRRNGVRAW